MSREDHSYNIVLLVIESLFRWRPTARLSTDQQITIIWAVNPPSSGLFKLCYLVNPPVLCTNRRTDKQAWLKISWWSHGNTLASHRYGLGSIQLRLPTACGMSFTLHSQSMPGGFPSGFSSSRQKHSTLFQLALSHKADLSGQNLFWVT